MYGALVLRISRTLERADAMEPRKKNMKQRHLSDVEKFAKRLNLRTARGLVKLARSPKSEDADRLAETAINSRYTACANCSEVFSSGIRTSSQRAVGAVGQGCGESLATSITAARRGPRHVAFGTSAGTCV